MKLVPLHGRVLIKTAETVNGIIIPESVTTFSMKRGIIEAVAEGVKRLRVGDEVYFGIDKTMLDQIDFNGEHYFITEAHSVVAVVETE